MSSRVAYLGERSTFSKLLSGVLAGSGYELVVFLTAPALAATVEAAPASYAAIIVDAARLDRVPPELAPLMPQVPTVLVNAPADAGLDLAQTGAPIALGKPLSVPKLLTTLQRLGRRPARTEPAAGGPPTALVVDDEEAFRLFVEHILTQLGWRVLTAQDGAEALRVLDAHPGIQTFVLDLEMPVMDGPTLVGHLQQRCASPSILIMTGTRNIELLRWAKTSGVAYGLLEKPFTSRTFLRYFH